MADVSPQELPPDIALNNAVLKQLFLKSIGIALLLFVFVHVLQFILGAAGALKFGITSTIYLNSIDFDVDAYGWRSYGAVILAYTGGLSAILVIGLFAYAIYRVAWTFVKPEIAFVAGWVHLICFLYAFADMASGQIMRKGPFFGFNFLFHKYQISENFHFVITGFSIISLYVTGGLAAYRFLRALPSVDLIIDYGNKVLTGRLLVVPVFISVVLLGATYNLIGGLGLRFTINLIFIASSVLVGWLVSDRFKDITLAKTYPKGNPYLWIIAAVLSFGLALAIFGGGYSFN
jgi:hypothetical protein